MCTSAPGCSRYWLLVTTCCPASRPFSTTTVSPSCSPTVSGAIATVESGYMTKDLALLVGPDQNWLTTRGFLDKVDENLKAAMAKSAEIH